MDEDDDNEVERVTAASYGALDTSLVTDDCWMIRLPAKLAELWEKAEEGTELGELVITRGGTVPETADGTTKTKTIKPSMTVHISETLVHDLATAGTAKHPSAAASTKKSPAMPLNYSLQAMTKKIPVMHPFVRNPNNGSCKLLGTVSRTANLQVDQDNNYRAQLKDRMVATNLTGNRFVKPVEATESIMTKQRTTSVNVNC